MLDKVSGGREWIAQFRHENGLTRQEMAKCMTDVFGKHVSEGLIAWVETGDRIHPGIAARFAYLAGGTAAQFDAITYETRRGTWTPDAKARRNVRLRFQRWMQRRAERIAAAAARKGAPESAQDKRERGVLVIEPGGDVIREFPSIAAAAKAQNTSMRTIQRRCEGEERDNFRKYGVVWRYADEYTGEERERLIELAQVQMKPTTDLSYLRKYDRIELNGEVHSMEEWAARLGTDACTIRSRFRRGWTVEDALTLPIGTRIAERNGG